MAYCSEADVGQSTLATRKSMGNIFGGYSTEFKLVSPCDVCSPYFVGFNLFGSNVTDYSSIVFAVSEQYLWEQELMRFKLQLPFGATYEDVK